MTQDYMMTKKRTEAIDRWKLIISTVFAALASISNDWEFRLRAAKHLGKKEREKISQEYIMAIAEEIVSHTTDEEIEAFKD